MGTIVDTFKVLGRLRTVNFHKNGWPAKRVL